MSDARLTANGRLIRGAADVLGCGCAVLYRLEANTLYPSACHGIEHADAHPLPNDHWLVPDRGIDAIHVYDDVSADDDAVPRLMLAESAVPRFMVLAPVVSDAGSLVGLCLVADAAPRLGLSLAKRYALSSHAMRLSYRCECDAVREPPADHAWPESDRLRLLESVVVHAKDAILITEAAPIDQPGPRIVYCNAAFTQITGYTEAEVFGSTPRLLQNANTSRAALDRLRGALEHWQPIELELLNQRKDGTEFWVELSVVPVADDHGRCTHWISVQRDISERKRAERFADQARIAKAENAALEAELRERRRVEQSLVYAASHDDLTHLRNRAHIMEQLQRLVVDGESGGAGRASLLFLDMDGFKRVNDTLGHRAGDLLLMQMARRLETCVRADDTLARMGGDEFVVLIENEPERRAAVEVAERIAEAFRPPFRIGSQDIDSSASIGIVHIEAHHDSPEQLVRDADLAMYAAKRAGAGRYRLFTEAMRETMACTRSLHHDLRQALASDQFTLAYQPIHALSRAGCIGVEALARWRHPQRGWVAPGVFVPAAEQAGVIRELGHWIMSRACAQVQAWATTAELKLFVNIAVSEIHDHRFIDQIDEALAASGLLPSRLQIEITEKALVYEPERIAPVLEALRERGIGIVLDDFGSGYSSLHYLERYPIDALKIDREFITRMMEASRTQAIMGSILSLGKALGVDIVAEGIETRDELDLLERLGCPFGQGQLLGPPMSAERFAASLDS